MSEVLEAVGGCGGDGRGSKLVRGVVCCIARDGRDRSVRYGCISLIENAGMGMSCKEGNMSLPTCPRLTLRYQVGAELVLTVSEKSLCFSVY